MNLPRALLNDLEDFEPGEGATIKGDAWMTITNENDHHFEFDAEQCRKLLTSIQGVELLIKRMALDGGQNAEMHGVNIEDPQIQEALDGALDFIEEV